MVVGVVVGEGCSTSVESDAAIIRERYSGGDLEHLNGHRGRSS